MEGVSCPVPQSPAANHKVPSSPEPMPMTAAAQRRAKSRLAGAAPTRGRLLSPQLVLFALCSMSSSSIRINP